MDTQAGPSALAEQGWSINLEKLQALRSSETGIEPNASLQQVLLDNDLKKVQPLRQAHCTSCLLVVLVNTGQLLNGLSYTIGCSLDRPRCPPTW